MTQLVLLRFDEVHGAHRALAAIRALTELRYAWVDDLAVVERHRNGRVSTHTPHGSSGEGAWWGALVGMVVGWWFPPLTFLLAAGAGAGVGALVGELSKEHGFDEDLVRRVRSELAPGTSALLMIGPHGDVDEMARAFAPYHPTSVIREDLSDDTVEKLHSTLSTPLSTPLSAPPPSPRSNPPATAAGGAVGGRSPRTRRIPDDLADPTAPGFTAEVPSVDLTPLRLELEARGLVEEDLTDDPLDLFRAWYAHAGEVGVHEPEAMVLGTATTAAVPSSRFVLLKGVDERGFSFYTNRTSRKGDELDTNPVASLVFPWIQLSRQVRVEGAVERVSDEESDEYFASRPRVSQIGAWASQQSQVIDDRGVLERRVAEAESTYDGVEVPRPPHWGGYLVRPIAIEFWQARPFRLHDRFRYERRGEGWRRDRLSP